MRLLLDTNAFLWHAGEPHRLNAGTIRLLERLANERWLSVASIIEIAIKVSIGKLRIPLAPRAFVEEACDRLRVRTLEITTAHAFAVASLPRMHRDPFDRILIAQAKVEDLTIVTSDEAIAEYAVKIRRA